VLPVGAGVPRCERRERAPLCADEACDFVDDGAIPDSYVAM
jgi:hypothetical protein